MSFFGRLFGSKPAAAIPDSVVIDAQLAAALTADGSPLEAAVNRALRAHLEEPAALTPPSEPVEPEIPFWLARDEERTAADENALREDELRDRVIQRHEAEDEKRQP
jgi:hypothetical protein